MEYFMIKNGDTGWIGYSIKPVINGMVDFVSPLGCGNMTGTGEYPIEDLIRITEEEYINISTPQVAWILEDMDTQKDYEIQLQKVMKKYNLTFE